MRVLLAGITGYLGGYIAKELHERGHFIRAIARTPEKLKQKGIEVDEILRAEITKPDAVKNCCKNIDVVISTVGITRQRDGLTYMDVDYQANMNLLKEAVKSEVKKFIYISVLNGEKLRHLKICNAKEMFVEQLGKSGLVYCVIRPNGFFSDMSEFLNMARKGRIYLFGNGEFRANPIHGRDLAKICVDAVDMHENNIKAGGPEILTQREIAEIAFDVSGNKPKITFIPEWVIVIFLKIIRFFTGSKFYGPIEFFMTVMAMDMVAPQYGKTSLREYFTEQQSEKN